MAEDFEAVKFDAQSTKKRELNNRGVGNSACSNNRIAFSGFGRIESNDKRSFVRDRGEARSRIDGHFQDNVINFAFYQGITDEEIGRGRKSDPFRFREPRHNPRAIGGWNV